MIEIAATYLSPTLHEAVYQGSEMPTSVRADHASKGPEVSAGVLNLGPWIVHSPTTGNLPLQHIRCIFTVCV